MKCFTICAMMTINPACRIRVDFPPMLGPVTNTHVLSLFAAASSQSIS